MIIKSSTASHRQVAFFRVISPEALLGKSLHNWQVLVAHPLCSENLLLKYRPLQKPNTSTPLKTCMFIPFISRRATRRKLVARKGGGAGEDAGGGAHPAAGGGAHPAASDGAHPAAGDGAHPATPADPTTPGGGSDGSSGDGSSGGDTSDLPGGNTPGLTAGIDKKINCTYLISPSSLLVKGVTDGLFSDPVSVVGKHMTATSYAGGDSKVSLIPSGQLFAGRQEGGGTRADIYGTR
jgi:hypothetical protein